ncbi:MAG: hypothetical protein AAB011_02260, partial [Candidatus Eisenbacteria bacterium]
VMVRLHVDEENAAAVGEFLDDYRVAFGNDSRFALFIRGLSKLGGPNDATLPILAGERRARTIEHWRRMAAESGIQLAQVPAGAICYAAKGNSFVVRADGRINKCTVALEHPENQVGNLHPDGSIRLVADKVRPWMRGIDRGDRALLGCPMHGLADHGLEPAPPGRSESRITELTAAATGGGRA